LADRRQSNSTDTGAPEVVAAAVRVVTRPWLRWFEVAVRAAIGYGKDRAAIFAAGVTYYALVSLFPLALFAAGALAFFISDASDQQDLINELMESLPLTEDDGRSDLESVVDSVVSQRGTLGLIGFAGTAFTASALFTSVRVALNGVFHVEQQRPFVLGKAIDLGLVAGFGLLLLASFALTVGIAIAQREADALVGDNLATLVAWAANLAYLLIPPLVTGLVFLLLYTTVARAGFTPREVLPGVAVAALLFEALKIGFAQYVASFGDYDATYGTLGFVIILLLFFNLSAQVMLVGAEVARANVEVRASEASGEGLPVTSGILAKLQASLERARSLPVVGHLMPRLPQVLASLGAASEVESPAPEGAAARQWLMAPSATTEEQRELVDVTAGSAREDLESIADAPQASGDGETTVLPDAEGESSVRFGRWAALTAAGFAVAVWLSGRDR
jgi:membrane protein